MPNTITVTSIINPDKKYQYVDNGEPMQGGMKDVYFSPDRSYVVALYRSPQDFNSKERLKKIVTTYYNNIFNNFGGSYYKELYSWPTDVITINNKTGIIVPTYNPKFFFQQGYAANDLIKGQEKQGKWFAAPKFRHREFSLRLADAELGNWMSYLQICVNIARGVKRLHSGGLAHSDLSYKNVLVDPVTQSAAIIDIDGLVVPGLYPPDVIGTADFIAPEVLATKHLNLNDENRKLPSRLTDLHALAVMIYMYLLYRHPLKGGKVHALEPEEDDLLSMGEKALFIEHPTDATNRPKLDQINPKELPWADVTVLPYTITGPYLSDLFKDAFIKGLHYPAHRPTADQWETALLKTSDLLQRCRNSSCRQKWYVFDNTSQPKCPFCNTPHQGSLPIFDLYYNFNNTWKLENQRLMIYHEQPLMQWHVDRNVIRSINLSAEQKKPVGYFSFHNGQWVLVNQKLTSLKDVTANRPIGIGEMVALHNGQHLLLSSEPGGRLVLVTMVN